MATYRAIEEGLPVIRAASNGITGVIDPYGRYEVELGPKDTGVIDVKLPASLGVATLFSYRVNYLLFLINLLVILMCLTILRQKNDI